MALQTKIFTWGSYAYQSESRSYVLELTLTENYVDQTNNRSNISYKLVLKSGSNNRFQGDVTSVLKLNGVQVASKTANKYLDYNSSWTLLEGTTNVSHSVDGTLNMPVVVVIDTVNSYAPPDKTLSWSWELTDIPRASSITSAANVALGNACSVRWTPNSATFRYKLKFSIGSWSYTTPAIHPNKTSAYIYTGYTLPVEVAEQITSSKTGTMTVKLTTYSDSGCTTSIGTDSEIFTVTVPENDYTKPAVTMKLSPVQPPVMAEDSPLYGFYLQGITRIKVALEATPQQNTSITGYSLEVDDKNYSISSTATTATIQSNPVVNPGETTVTGKATDKRTITGSTEKTITVLPYSKPTLKATAYRCRADMSRSDTGIFLKIDIDRSSYAPVEVDGEAQNSLSILWRHRSENGKFPDGYMEWTDEALLEGTLAVDTAYEIEIVAVDLAGQKETVYVSIPTESIYKHKPAGGRGLGLGGYCDEDDLLDVHWNVRIRKSLTIGDEQVDDFVVEEGRNGDWNYRKWHSGIAECWCAKEYTGKTDTAWSSLYGLVCTPPDYPDIFIRAPATLRDVAQNTGNSCWLSGWSAASRTNPGTFALLRPTPALLDVTVNFFAIGNWK